MTYRSSQGDVCGRLWRAARLVLMAAAAGPAFAQCAAPALITPGDTIVADTRPHVIWSPVPGATGYALSLQSRVAEGRLIASYDVSLATNEFVPPAALTDEKATVTVTVLARCGTTAGPAHTASFRIDATRTCGTPRNVAIAAEGASIRTTWEPVAGAVHYEVRAHAPLDGRQLAVMEVREPRAALAAPAAAGTVVSVRPRCAAAYGESAFAAVAPR